MRITYRKEDSAAYWSARWANVAADEPMENKDAYPLKYALEAVSRSRTPNGGLICEAGCGNGRLVRYFIRNGYAIKGFDFIPEAIEKIRAVEPGADVETGDILNLRYPDEIFDTFLAFGLYHSLPWEIQDRALRETFRVMKPGGTLCMSFRADNLCTRISDYLREKEEKGKRGQESKFHKLNLAHGELTGLLARNGFTAEKMDFVVNMPILYKFALFRHGSHKIFDEHKGRREGYLLNLPGRILWRGLMRFFPDQACNVFVIQARKLPDNHFSR